MRKFRNINFGFYFLFFIDIWRDNWGKSYELVDQRLLSDVKNFTTPNGWNEFHLACL